MICRRLPTMTFSTLAMIFFAVAATSAMNDLESLETSVRANVDCRVGAIAVVRRRQEKKHPD